MSRAGLRGIIPALLTPMSADETVNFPALREQVDRLIGAGVHGLFILGTNSEFYALSYEERTAIARVVVEHCNGRVPVCAGTGCVSTRDTVELSRTVSGIGVDAIAVVTPYYVSVSEDELCAHYRDVAMSVSLPVLLYNIPARTGNSISARAVASLSRIENVVGIKDTSGDFNNTLAYIEAAGPEFSVFAGNDSLILWTLLAGGAGGISGLANVVPELIVSLYEHWNAGDMAGAARAQNSIRPLRACLRLGNPNSIIKRAANLAGHAVGPARRPASGADERIDAEISAALASLMYDGSSG